ncbi:hypothetical protein B4Q13_21900, partial [Lacticaseibacillus rhamnosus]
MNFASTSARKASKSRSKSTCGLRSTGKGVRPFRHQGFSRPPGFSRTRNIPAEVPGPAAGAGFEIRPGSEQESQSAAAVITAAYRGHVDAEINDQ